MDSSVGVTEISDSQFTHVPGVGPDAAGSQDSVSNVVPIGFDFQIDGITYKQFVVSMHGWMALIDPTLGSFNLIDAITNGSTWLNTRINTAGFTTKQVLLAPWFDDSRALAATPGALTSIDGAYSATQITRILDGLEPPPNAFNAVAFGVSYYNDNRSTQGRRLIVRWNIVSNYYNGTATSVLKFEAVLYENGTIEYRYSPKGSKTFPPQLAYPSPKGTKPVYAGFEGATVGIFMPNGANRFRDFAVGLGYREGSRQDYIYGGFTYTSAYTDSDASGNPTYTFGGEDFGFVAKYTVNLLPSSHWPGLNAEGGVFRFEPPVNRRKVLPRKDIRKRDGLLQLPLVARTGDDRQGTNAITFDDRKSPQYAQISQIQTVIINPGIGLDGLEWLLPRTGDLNGSVYITVPTQTVVATLQGDPNQTYAVPLRFRGVIETKGYSGYTVPDPLNSFWIKGGTPSGSDWNIYQLNISNPPATYYLNLGADNDFHVHLIDYTETVLIKGGATVTLIANPVDSGPYEIANNSNTGGPISVPGITSPAQPYVGQFIVMNFVGSGSLVTAQVESKSQVNYPTTLPRFFGGTGIGTYERQNLFSGDMVVTGAIAKSAVEPYLGEGPTLSILPYDESRRPSLVDPPDFFATGSSVKDVGPGFDQPLKSKTQVRFQLPVNVGTILPGDTASIFYYNQQAKAWEVPANSSYILAIGATTPPAGTKTGDLSSAQTYLSHGQQPEDARGFGPVGNLVASGSHVTGAGANQQTDPVIGSLYDNTKLVQYIAKKYPKSIRSNDNYAPADVETFTIPITQPFLIEKAIFEIPIAFGPGWFGDVTQVFSPVGAVSFSTPAMDFGGPGLTVALMRHIPMQEQGQSGDAGGSKVITATSTRDMILTGTITHSVDYVSGVAISTFPPDNGNYQLRPYGFLSFASPAGAVVPVPRNLQFTGSVLVKAQATSVAGVDVAYTSVFLGTNAQNASGALGLLTSPTLPLGNGAFGTVTKYSVVSNYISPFGRSGGGFQQSGRAILGNEFATLQGSFDPTGNSVANPFYVGATKASVPPQVQAALDAGAAMGGAFNVSAPAMVSLKSHFTSPYLVMPGDQLVLSISKMRPFTYSQTASPLSASVLPHDVRLLPGNINITLYGSQVQEGVEYHDTLNQPLASDVCHEVIGAEPVLDQFEPAYRNEFSGSLADNVMFGQLLTSMVSNGQLIFQQGTRDRRLSVLGTDISSSVFLDIRTVDTGSTVYPAGVHFPPHPLPPINVYNSVPPTLGLTWTDALLNSSKAYREQPWVEQVGITNLRLTQFTDETERYWDSLMPAVDQAFAADGCGIFVTRYGAFGNSEQVQAVTGSLLGEYLSPVQNAPLGWLWFDYQLPAVLQSGYSPLINANWTKAYPFEPRYQNASREIDVRKGLIATYLFQPAVTLSNIGNTVIPAGTPIVLPIPPTPVSGFMFGPVQQAVSVGSTIIGYTITYRLILIYIPFFGYIFFYFPIATPIQTLAYTNNDLCNGWLSDATVGPSGTISSSVGYVNAYGYYTTSSAGIDDISRCLFGFGDNNGYFQRTNADTSISLLGTGHYADFRDQEGPHPNGLGINGIDNNVFKFSPKIRGWKYGVASGLPLFSKAYWRQGKFGQFRDMLEQRLYTKYYESPENGPSNPNFQQGVKQAVVTVKYLSPDGRLTEPSNTWSSNLSFECTSSIPYIEGVPTNRPYIAAGPGGHPTVNPLILNKHILSFRQDIFGNLRI